MRRAEFSPRLPAFCIFAEFNTSSFFMLKFLHTADLQIGMTAPGVGQLAHKVQEARLSALERVLVLGRERNADFIVVAGDLFESNRISRRLVMRTADILRTAAQPVLIIAGNHDYYDSSSVYCREEFLSAGSHVHVFARREPVVFADFDVTIYPCPCFETRSPESPVAWVKKQAETTYHVCIAHGNIPEHIASGEHDYPMSENQLRALGMDYVALGHWHSVHPDPMVRPDSPFFYSGTPEPTRFGERDSGNVLWVEIGEGVRKVTAIPTALYRFVEWNRHIRGSEDVAALRRDVELYQQWESTLVRLVVHGVVSMDVYEQLDMLADDVRKLAAFLVVRDDGLSLQPTDDDLRRFAVGGVSARLIGRLREKHDGAPESERAVYARAIALVYHLLREHA